MLVADAGTGKSGKVYNYYKCKHTKGCELKPVAKDRLEKAVLDATITHILNDEMIDRLTVKVLEVQEADEALDPAENYRRQLDGIKKKIKNTVTAIEDGAGRAMIARLTELEGAGGRAGAGDCCTGIEKATPDRENDQSMAQFFQDRRRGRSKLPESSPGHVRGSR